MTSADYLHTAFLLSKSANSKEIRPNPFVGAIIVDENDEIIGEGYHKKAGEAHAEVFAIQEAYLKKKDLSKCTLYVTLEPCSHSGKTPPCTKLIIEKGIQKVVIGSMDPNPLVAGAELLKEAGIQVEICLLPEIVALNNTFNINQIHKRPSYILKSATTLNGKIADRFGNSRWISNDKSRTYVHEILRSNADAILSTAKTIMKDNATMNVRNFGTAPKELNLIIIDKDLTILKEENKDLKIFYKRVHSKIFIVSSKSYTDALPVNVEIIPIKFLEAGLDLVQLNEILLQKNICEVLVEAGGKLNAALMNQQMVDEINMFICPSVLLDNESANAFNSNFMQTIDNSIQLKLITTLQFESDLLLKYKVLY